MLKKPYLELWNQSDGNEDNYQSVFLNMKRQWNDTVSGYIIRERQWKLVALLALGLCFLCAGGLVIIGTQNKLVPYVVAVDKLGATMAVSRADVASKPDTRLIRAQLARWVETVRSVYQDAGAERESLTAAYGMIRKTDPAYKKLNEYYSKQDPFQRAAKEGVDVEISTVLPISDQTWQVQWIETSHSSKGELIGSVPMQANVTVAIDPPTEERTLLKNPLGIYITQYNWSARL
jgi:type IV secretion system protein TrbF